MCRDSSWARPSGGPPGCKGLSLSPVPICKVKALPPRPMWITKSRFKQLLIMEVGQLVSSVTQFCPIFCDPMDWSTPGFHVHHQLPELAQSHSCPLSQWCHPTISSSIVPFSSWLQSFPASGSFLMSQFFVSGGQILEFQLQHQSFQWIFRTDFL